MVTEKRLIDANAIEYPPYFYDKESHPDPFIEGFRQGKIDAITDIVALAPTVDAVEVVHGRWEDCSDKFDKGMNLRCLVCGGIADSFVGGTEDWYCLWEPNFCPHCDAKMDKSEKA